MARVTFWLQLLLLVLILKQSYADNEQCRQMEEQISSLKEDLKSITEQKSQYEEFFGQCKVQVKKQIRISKHLSRKLGESDAVNNHSQIQLSKFKIKLEQSASVNNDLKKQLEAKEKVVQIKNEETELLQTTIDALTNTLDSVNQVLEELCEEMETLRDSINMTMDSVNQVVQELCGQIKDACPNLLEAIKSGDVNTVKILFKCTNERCIGNDPYVGTPLMYAAGYGYVEVAQVLLEGGANVDRAEADGLTALHVAAWSGNLDVCRLLLDWGAKVDTVNIREETPLHSAASMGYLSVVKLLVERGADVRLQNVMNATASEMAQSQVDRMEEVAEWLDSVSSGQGVSAV